MKFSELSVEQQIGHVKSKFTGIIADVVANPAKLEQYFPLPKALTKIEPKLIPLLLDMSEAEKSKAQTQNSILLKNAEEENAKIEASFKQQESNFKKIKDALGNIKARPECICDPKCLDVDACVNCVGPEFEPIIDAARKLAETDNYG